jgi:hypothetical protein
MRTKLLGGAALLLVLSSGVYAQAYAQTMSPAGCPAGVSSPKLTEAEGQGKGPKLAESDGQG